MNLQRSPATRPAIFQGVLDAPPTTVAQIIRGALHLPPGPASPDARAAEVVTQHPDGRVRPDTLAENVKALDPPVDAVRFPLGALWPDEADAAGGDA